MHGHDSTTESDEVLANQYRLAQAARLLRFARSRGLGDEDHLAGRIPGNETLCGPDGHIVPEWEDIEAARRARVTRGSV
jgi:hypothetical protein